MSTMYLDNLAATLNSLAILSDAEMEQLFGIAKTVTIPKGECFIRQGEVPQTFGFVCEGLFRYYYLTESGKEFTKGFFAETTFISAYSALLHHRESYFTIEALENSTIVVIEYTAWKALAKESLAWHKILLALLSKGYATKEEREREFLLFDAQTHYERFRQNYPDAEKRIKQHHIASYLGITPVALSRIRKHYKS